MKRKYNLRKIVSKRSYSTDEIAELLEVHIQTIRGWRKEGLIPIGEGSSPFLFLGADVKDFLKNELSKQKTHLKYDECYCLKCRKEVVPVDPKVIDRKIKLGNGNASAFLTGNCPECSHALRKFTSLENQNLMVKLVKKEVKSPTKFMKNKNNDVLEGQLSMFDFNGED